MEVLRPPPPGRGSAEAKLFWLRLATASAQRLQLSERFFITFAISYPFRLLHVSPKKLFVVSEGNAAAESQTRDRDRKSSALTTKLPTPVILQRFYFRKE